MDFVRGLGPSERKEDDCRQGGNQMTRGISAAWLLFMFVLLWSATCAAHGPGGEVYHAPACEVPPEIDGKLDEACWSKAKAASLRHLWLGVPPSGPEDLSGTFRVVWCPQTSKLYFGVSITDDSINDFIMNPLEGYWTDDCLEIFLDADHSGGDHTYNHSALALHLSTRGHAVDLGINKRPLTLGEDVIRCAFCKETGVWEAEVTPYDRYDPRNPRNCHRSRLYPGKVIGFTVAYCDNDGVVGKRESFLGWNYMAGPDRNQAWRTADVFGDLVLEE